MDERILDQAIEKDLAVVQQLVAHEPVDRAGQRRLSLYRLVLEQLAANTRHTSAQLECFEVFEQSLAVFRCASLALREAMDLLTIEQRQAVARESFASEAGQARESFASEAGQARESFASEAGQARESFASEAGQASFFSNRYALYFAGCVGLAELGEEQDALDRVFAFGDRHEESRDRDALTQILSASTTDCLVRMLANPPSTKAEVLPEDDCSEPLCDNSLRVVLVTVFSAWCRQLTWRTWAQTARATATDSLI